MAEIKISLNKNTLEKVSAGSVREKMGYYLVSNYWCCYCKKFDYEEDALDFDEKMQEACNCYQERCNHRPPYTVQPYESPEAYYLLGC